MAMTPVIAEPVVLEKGPDSQRLIRLYVAGSTPNSLRALQSLRDARLAMDDAASRLTIEVIDVFKGPKRAIADGILVTPTLIARYAGKRVMMVGDLSDAAALRSVLDACAGASSELAATLTLGGQEGSS